MRILVGIKDCEKITLVMKCLRPPKEVCMLRSEMIQYACLLYSHTHISDTTWVSYNSDLFPKHSFSRSYWRMSCIKMRK